MATVGAFIAGAVGASAPAIGSAAFGAWVAGVSVNSFLTTTFVGKLLTSVALTALSQALAPKPDAPGMRTQGTLAGGTNSEFFQFGRYATDGVFVAPAMSHSRPGKNKNYYLNYVIELSSLPGAQLHQLYIDGNLVTFGSSEDPDYGSPILGQYEGRAWLRYYDGTQVAADPMLLAKYPAGVARPWMPDMVGRGLCYAVLTFSYDRQVYSGFPRVRFVMNGVPVYDPRNDSSVGGAGTQRWGDQSTWSVSHNPVVQIYNIKRGIPLPGGGVWGGSVEADDLPLSNWFAGMNACDVAVDLGGGESEPKYRAGFEVRLADEPASVEEELLKACSAQVAEVGGVWRIRVGGPGLPVHFFSDADIIAGDPETFDPFPPSDEIYNGIHAAYPEPESGWQTRDAPPRYDASGEAEDGERRVADLALPAAPYGNQVQRLMHGFLAEERRFRQHELSLPSDALLVQPLDSVAWLSTRNGYQNKVFEVTRTVHPLLTSKARLALRERDNADFHWVPSLGLATDVAAPVLVVADVQDVAGFGVLAVSLQDELGVAKLPAIRLVWDGSLASTVSSIEWEVRFRDGAAAVLSGNANRVILGFADITDGVLPDTEYEARMRVAFDGPAVWTDWASVITHNVRPDLSDLDASVTNAISSAQAAADLAASEANAAGLVADGLAANLDALTLGFTDTLAGAFAARDADISASRDDLSNLLAGFAGGSLQGALDAQQLGLQANIDGLSATLAQNHYTAAETDAAFALSEAAMQARLDALSAQIASENYTAVETDQAIAASRQLLSAEIEGRLGAAWNLASVSDFADGHGNWPASYQIVSGPGYPAGVTHALHCTKRDTRDGDQRQAGTTLAGRVFRIRGWVNAEQNPYEIRVGIEFVYGSGGYTWPGVRVATPYQTGWVPFDIEITAPADVVSWVPWIVSDGASAATDHSFLVADLEWSDVTEAATIRSNLATNYMSAAETTGALTALETDLRSEVTSVSDAQSGYQVALEQVSVGSSGSGVSASPGNASLGQAGTVILTDQAGVSRVTSGVTNGFSITIPTSQALQFAGRRVRIAVLARTAQVNGSVRFEVAYSTSDTGNSGAMPSDVLSTTWAWHEFYYNVPAANAGGDDFLGLFGDGDRQGRATEFARVVVDVAQEASSLPEISQIQGQISDINGLDANALTGTAFGTMLEELSVAADGTVAGVSAFGSAMANLLGDAQASYRIAAVAGGSVGEVRVVAGNDGSEVLLRGDNIVAEGTLNVDRISVGLGVNMLENSDFAQGLLHTRRGGIGQVAASASLYLIPAGQLWATASAPSIVLKSTVDTNNDGFAELFFQPNLADGLSYSQGYAVEPLQYYEFALQATFHRVRWKVNVNFHDGLGNYISTAVLAQGDAGDGVTGGTGDAPLSWTRVGGACAAPANAVFARPVVQLLATNSAIDGMIIAHRPVFAQVGSLNAPLSPYRPGTNTLITGERVVTPNLSAISANIGHFKSAASGERVEILDDRILVYDAANQIRVKIGDLS